LSLEGEWKETNKRLDTSIMENICMV